MGVEDRFRHDFCAKSCEPHWFIQGAVCRREWEQERVLAFRGVHDQRDLDDGWDPDDRWEPDDRHGARTDVAGFVGIRVGPRSPAASPPACKGVILAVPCAPRKRRRVRLAAFFISRRAAIGFVRPGFTMSRNRLALSVVLAWHVFAMGLAAIPFPGIDPLPAVALSRHVVDDPIAASVAPALDAAVEPLAPVIGIVLNTVRPLRRVATSYM